jgi:hypothetical protein
LRGEDLKLLVSLGMARPEDEGRLYARVSDKGLAAELGMSRDTIARCAERLRQLKAIDILGIPEQMVAFRDSHGQFNGSKVYLLAGDIQSRFLEKELFDRAAKSGTVETEWMLGAAKTSTVEDEFLARVAKSRTVEPENGSESAQKPSDRAAICRTEKVHRAANSGTNLEEEEDRGGRIDNFVIFSEIFAYFAECKHDPGYQPSEKERAALEKMLSDGYSQQEILEWIDYAFSRTTKPRHFTFVAILAREQAETLPPQPRSQPESGQQPEARSQPESGLQPEAQSQPGTRSEAESQPDIHEAIVICQSTEREVTPDILARLRRMASSCDAAAQKQGSCGGEWLAEALEAGLGVAQPEKLLNYAAAVLGDWTTNGKPGGRTKTTDLPGELPPELLVFQQATGGRLPLPDQRPLVIQVIREKGHTAEALRPFWEAWVGRDRKRTDLDWLLDWAAKGQIPPAYGSAKSTSSPEFKSLPALQRVAARYGGLPNE